MDGFIHLRLFLMRPSRKNNSSPAKENSGLSGIVYILALLIGMLIFLLFGESFFGIKPNPIWIALLMGLSVSAIVFWIWKQIQHQDG